jgi:hypothetical protein
MDKRMTLTAFAALTAGVVLVGALAAYGFPQLIRSDALRIAGDRPYCLAVPDAHRPVQGWWDLTPFIARGNWLRQHLVLFVEGANGLEGYHWSYSESQFNPGAMGMQHCLPRLGFLDELRNDGPGFYFVMGGTAYLIPREFNAGHGNEDFIALDFGLTQRRPGGRDHVMIGAASVERWQRESIGQPTPEMTIGQRLRTEGAYGFSIRDFEHLGQIQQEFRCLSKERLCVLEFVAPPGVFHVVLDDTSVEMVPTVKQGILDTWEGFKLP